jgi:hypothetical protein
MPKERLTELREQLIQLRNECLLTDSWDVEGSVLLSHTIHYLACKIEGVPYKMATD